MKALKLLFVLMFASSANATLINFEDLSTNIILRESSVISAGYKVSITGPIGGASYGMIFDNSRQGGRDFSGNGTNRFTAFNQSTVSISNGSTFDLIQFDGGESWIFSPHDWATSITVTGFLSDGGTTIQNFDLDLLKDTVTGMETFVFNSTFTSLTSVSFNGIGGNPEFSIDNILIPEPNTLVLLALSLTGICFSRKRKTK